EPPERRAGAVALGRAGDGDLARRREIEVERAQRPAERGGRAWQRVAHEAQDAGRTPLEVVLAPDTGEPDQDEREHRVAGRRRIVVEVLAARDELLAVGGRQEEAAPFVVREELHRA